MLEGIYKTAKMLKSKERNLDIIANNLANINSIGYKREIPFSDYLNRFKDKSIEQLTDFRQGSFVETDNPMDLAISGNGFFAVQTNDGLEYTKNGKFTIAPNGEVVNEDGYPLVTTGGALNALDSLFKKEKTFHISPNGEIRMGNKVIDKLMIVQFNDSKKLFRSDGQRFKAEEDNVTNADDEQFEILQGYLEESNVSPIIEMKGMLQLNKDYESTQKMISSFDNIMGQSAKEIGRV